MADTTKNRKLFTEFPPISTPEWEEKIKVDLKGADYEKKLVWKPLEGFKVNPYYRSENLEDKNYLDSLPGEYPYTRGIKANNNHWEIRQDIKLEDIKEANRKSLFVLDRGITSLGFITPAQRDSSIIKAQADFSALLKDIYFECIHLNFVSGYNSPQLLEFLAQEAKDKNIEADKIRGAMDFDPLGYLTRFGNFSASEEKDFEELIALVKFAEENLPYYKVIGINGYCLNNSGASAVQELGYSLAMAAEYFSILTEAGFSIDTISKHMQLNLGVGPNYFMEIAKIRAARFLWAKLVEAYNPDNKKSLKADIHSITSEWNQTIYDPYVNVLRATTESMAAVIGGTNALTVRPFTYSYQSTTKFSGRIARNIQIILKEEAYLGNIADPAAGSYYIENLTDSIITEAWNTFLKVEEEGGYLAALKKGFVQEDVKKTSSKRDELVAQRREVFLGTNQYANTQEKVMDNIDMDTAFPDEIPGEKIVEPIPKYRGAMPFEELRLATEKSDKQPKVFLLTAGNLTMRKARASFSWNFFACAGYEIIDNLGFDTAEAGAKAALEAGADIVVVCSSDDEYADLVPAVKKHIGDKAILVVAGAPACMDDLKTQGIEHFIHMRSNVLTTLQNFHEKLGIKF